MDQEKMRLEIFVEDTEQVNLVSNNVSEYYITHNVLADDAEASAAGATLTFAF